MIIRNEDTLPDPEHEYKLSEIAEELKKVFNWGYGDTIELKINGSSYRVIDDLTTVSVPVYYRLKNTLKVYDKERMLREFKEQLEGLK